jgi:hypothetical protein
MHDSIAFHPFWALALSLIPLSLAVYVTVTGTAMFKSEKSNRSTEPFNYWFTLAFEYGFLFGCSVCLSEGCLNRCRHSPQYSAKSSWLAKAFIPLH